MDLLWCRSDQVNLFSVLGGMFAATLFLGVNNASNVQPVVAVERTIFYREHAAGMYSAVPYALGQVTTFNSRLSVFINLELPEKEIMSNLRPL